jgi:hypothetical protein
MLLVRSCHLFLIKGHLVFYFKTLSNVKYTPLDSVVREALFSADMFQCMEMGDVLKILCNLEKGPTKF